MKVDGQHYRTIWIGEGDDVHIIDQRKLPHVPPFTTTGSHHPAS